MYVVVGGGGGGGSGSMVCFTFLKDIFFVCYSSMGVLAVFCWVDDYNEYFFLVFGVYCVLLSACSRK